MGLGPYRYQIRNKIIYTPKISKFYTEKRIPMLKDIKVSSLPSKCVFNKTEHFAKADPIGTEFWIFRKAEIKYNNE